jgi:hypothetical protein
LHEHAVQFFGHERGRLTDNVAGFLQEGLRQGGAALVVASPAQRDALRQTIGTVRVTYLDDRETLAQILGGDGRPEADRFESVVGTRARHMLERHGTLCAYGEMVSVLWGRGECEAALQLEALWNGLMHVVPLDLFCGYAIDVFDDEFQIATVHSLLAAHTRVASSVAPGFNAAMERAMEDLWGDQSQSLRSIVHQDFHGIFAEVPAAERTILRLRSSLPRYADGILEYAAQFQDDDGRTAAKWVP